MNTDLFYWLLNAGIFGTFIGLFVLLIGRFRRIPKRVIYLLWTIPFLRLWMPFGISNRFSVLTFISGFFTKIVPVTDSEAYPKVTGTNYVAAAESYFPVKYKTSLLESIFSAAALVWLIGFCVLVLTFMLLYIYTMSEMKNAKHSHDNVYISDRITAPVLYGIIKPKIILPVYMEHEESRYVFLHENSHLKRHDNLFRTAALVTAALHWYNPLIWLLLKKYYEDLELACDECCIRALSGDERREYAKSLLSAAESRNAFVCAFGGAKIRVRIENILNYRSLSLISAIIFTIFIIVIAAAFLTNAAL